MEWRERLPLDFGREAALARGRRGFASAPASAWLAAGLVLIGLTSSAFARPSRVKGEATFSASGGYARLVLKLAEDVESQVSTAGSILVIRFKRPVDIPVDKLSDAVPDYVGSVRRDPDGSAIRLSLARKVTVNTMTAGERVFVDLLPDSWSGQPPALPAEVVRELSERARVAERALRQQRAAAEAKKRPPIRVRASVQPTFVRFVFEMPDGVGVSSVLNDQKLSLLFNAALSFDLADAKLAAPSNIASIDQKIEGETSVVEVALIGDVDVHSFREEKNYIIDVAFQQPDKPPAPALAAPARCSGVSRPAPAAHRLHPRGRRGAAGIAARRARSCRRPRKPSPSRPGSRSSPIRRRSRSRVDRRAGAGHRALPVNGRAAEAHEAAPPRLPAATAPQSANRRQQPSAASSPAPPPGRWRGAPPRSTRGGTATRCA